MSQKPRPSAPDGLRESGRRLWDTTVGEYELAVHEEGLLLQACRTVDALDALQAALDADGPLINSPQGRKANPALPELRQQRIAYARLIAALGLPTGVDDDNQPKAQRRST